MQDWRTVILPVLVVALAGCSGSSVKELTPTPNGVSYEYSGTSLESVSKKAADHCSRLGKTANLSNVSQLENGGEVATFTCR